MENYGILEFWNIEKNLGIIALFFQHSFADAEVYLATSPRLKDVTGKYFHVKSEAKAEPQAYDKQARKRLWELSLKLTNLK